MTKTRDVDSERATAGASLAQERMGSRMLDAARLPPSETATASDPTILAPDKSGELLRLAIQVGRSKDRSSSRHTSLSPQREEGLRVRGEPARARTI